MPEDLQPSVLEAITLLAATHDMLLVRKDFASAPMRLSDQPPLVSPDFIPTVLGKTQAPKGAVAAQHGCPGADTPPGRRHCRSGRLC